MVSGKKAMRKRVSFFIFSGGAARAVFMLSRRPKCRTHEDESIKA